MFLNIYANAANYLVIMADANGNPLNLRGGTVETCNIYKREAGKTRGSHLLPPYLPPFL